MEHLISVIVCTYNQEDSIGRALDSVLMQQCHLPFEIIIGEDHSTDHTLDICKSYAEKHPNIIRIIANETNKGLVDNYFDCLLSSRGEYITDCAGDDFWTDPLKLEKESRLLEEHPEVTLVHTAWQYYNAQTHVASPNGIDSDHIQTFTPGEELLQRIVTQRRHPVIQLSTALFRKEIFLRAYEADTYLFRNKAFGCEDLQIAFAMARSGKIAYLPDITMNYVVGKKSVSERHNDKEQFEFVRQVTDLSHYLSTNYQITGHEVDKYFTQRLFELSMHAFRAHSTDLRNQAKQLQRNWHAECDCRTQIVRLAMSNEMTWNTALLVRRIVVSLKRLMNR